MSVLTEQEIDPVLLSLDNGTNCILLEEKSTGMLERSVNIWKIMESYVAYIHDEIDEDKWIIYKKNSITGQIVLYKYCLVNFLTTLSAIVPKENYNDVNDLSVEDLYEYLVENKMIRKKQTYFIKYD
jgi:hypothetical protein